MSSSTFHEHLEAHRRGMLRHVIVRLLQLGPKNGAEIIAALEKKTHGRWVPSPGSLYPRLSELVEERTIRRRPDGRYELAPGARRVSRWGADLPARTPEEILRELDGTVQFIEDMLGDARVRASLDRDRVALLLERLRAIPN